MITDAHTAPDQHQKLTTSRGSPLAHADPMFHRRPQMHSSVILVSQRSLMPGWGLACADTLYKYTFTLLYRHSEWQTNSSDHITLPWPNVGPVFRRLNKQLITIIITTTMFMVLSSRQSHCESSPGSFDECRMAPSGRRPKTKPDDCPPVQAARIYTHHRHLLLLLSPKADTHFTIPQRVESWVELASWLHTEIVYPSIDGYPSWY